VFEHSAKSGELDGGRLVLRGVNRRVTWVRNDSRSGVVAVRRLHRRLFLPGKPVFGTLHVAGHRGGDEPTLRLSRPRYNAARHTVSYKARPLNNKRLPGEAAGAAAAAVRGSFGAASLSMVGLAQTGADCMAAVRYDVGADFSMQVNDYSKWDTDTWNLEPERNHEFSGGLDLIWDSYGGTLRGCGNTVYFGIASNQFDYNRKFDWTGTVTVNLSFDWTGKLTSSSCTVTGDASSHVQCEQVGGAPITWRIHS
jgi:hypothetical protein